MYDRKKSDLIDKEWVTNAKSNEGKRKVRWKINTNTNLLNGTHHYHYLNKAHDG